MVYQKNEGAALPELDGNNAQAIKQVKAGKPLKESAIICLIDFLSNLISTEFVR